MAAMTTFHEVVTGSAIGAGSSARIRDFSQFKSQRDYNICVRATGNATFRLNLLTTSDGGTTWVVAKQVASAVVSVDGGVAGYVNNAEINAAVGAEMAIEIWAVGGTLAYVADVRISTTG